MREGWEYKKLGEICEIFGRIGFRGYTREDYVNTIEEGAISLSPSNIINNQLDFSNCTYITWDKFNQSPEIKIVEGDVLFVKTASVGKCAYVSVLPHESTINPQFVVFKNISISNRFLFYQLLSSSFQYKVKRITSGTSVPTITQKGLSELKICYPNISEQQRIVSELDLLSSIIEKKKAQLKEYDQLAQSIFFDMFGDPVSNEKGWEVKKLGEVISVKGRVGWKGYKKEDLRESGPLAIGGGHITENGSLDFSSPVYLSMEKYEESPEIMVQRGDLIMVQRGTIGRIGLVKNEIGEATINPCVLILRPLAVSGLYVLHLMLNKIMQRCLQELVRGVAQPMITQKQVNSLIVPLPPLSLQQSFASKIEAIERQKALIQQSITEAETLFNSRMDFWFS